MSCTAPTTAKHISDKRHGRVRDRGIVSLGSGGVMLITALGRADSRIAVIDDLQAEPVMTPPDVLECRALIGKIEDPDAQLTLLERIVIAETLKDLWLPKGERRIMPCP
jgi:hypothetical protein